MQFAPFYPIIYQLLKPTFSDCLWCGVNTSPSVALTFDDGPHPDYTPKLLEVLERYQVRATFFLLGCLVERYPHIVREIHQRGHWIGLHGYDHQSFPFLSSDALKQSLLKTKEAIASVCHLDPDTLLDVRPPNGLFTPQILRQLRAWNYRVVMWSVVPEDWVAPGVAIVRQRILTHLHSGALIVLHDGYHGGKDVAQITADLIPRLQQQGYHFLTVQQMWQQKLKLAS